MNVSYYDATSILSATGGFLVGEYGYTHTLNPAIGCTFGGGLCGLFCYAAQGMAHKFNSDGHAWGKYLKIKQNAPELLKEELTRAAKRDVADQHHVSNLAIFASSSTDPCAGQLLATFRECLRVVADFPVKKFVIQTRSPAVLRLQQEVEALGSRGVVSFTIETDSDRIWDVGPKGAPGIGVRRSAFEELSGWAVTSHLAVAPCLTLEDAVAFADWIAQHADYATVDTFVSGDGSPDGRRTAKSELPILYERQGWDWRDEGQAKELLSLLQNRLGDRAGWSSGGFRRLANL